MIYTYWMLYGLGMTAFASFLIYKLNKVQKNIKSETSSLAHLKTMLSRLSSSAVITNSDGEIVYMNENFLVRTGYEVHELLDQNIQMLKGTLDNEVIARDLWQNLSEGRVWRGPFANVSKSGETYVDDFLIFPVDDEEGHTYFCAIGYNVANRYLEEKEIEQLQRKSIQFKENFIINLSHDVRTPINALVGLSQLGTKCTDPVKMQSYFTKIYKSSKQLMRLMDDILDFSKMESGSFELVKNRFNFMSLLNALTSQYGPEAAEKHLDFNFFIDDHAPHYLVGDSFKIEQIISNILSNAIKFTYAGEIRLSVAMFEDYHHAYQLIITISDTGVGMDKEHVSGLFNPFPKLVEVDQRRLNGSSGLGMAITKQIIDMMRGSIHVDSKPEEGTTITIALPFAQEEVELLVQGHKTIEQLRVLVIDNYETARSNTEMLLKHFNYTVVSASSCSQALDLTSQDHEFNLVILDWDLADFNCIETLSKIMDQINPAPKLLCITPYGKDGLPDGIKNMVHGYLPKPFTGPGLFDEIASLFVTQKISHSKSNSSGSLFKDFKIMLVDDNPVNNIISKGLFEDQGAQTITFTSAIKALDVLRNSQYHFIVSDIDMPEMDGFAFLKMLRFSNNSTPMFALTANTSDEYRIAIQEAGFDLYVTKPLTKEKLRTILETYQSNHQITDAENFSEEDETPLSIKNHFIQNYTETECGLFLDQITQLMDHATHRKPKQCKELLLKLQQQYHSDMIIAQLMEHFISELSRYRFDPLIQGLADLNAQLKDAYTPPLGGDKNEHGQ